MQFSHKEFINGRAVRKFEISKKKRKEARVILLVAIRLFQRQIT